MVANQSSSSKWYVKYFDAFFIFMGVGYLSFVATMFLPEKAASLFYSVLRIRYRFLLVPVAMSFLYLIIVNSRERQQKFNAEKVHAILFGVIRFWLAAAVSSYGFAKISGAQFQGSGEIILRDSLLGDVSGNYLTWHYFNFSHTYMLIIGYVQIGGALLLLFRRTTLAGIFILLPVMINIVLIDLFYGIPPVPTANAIVFTAALIYLLLLYSRKLLILFFKKDDALPKRSNNAIKNTLRIAVVAFAFINIYQSSLRYRTASTLANAELSGKWKVEQSSINGTKILPNAWQTDSGVWTIIYFFDDRYCAIGSNPYYFDRTKQNFGKYNFDKSQRLLNIYFFNTKDSLHGRIDFITTNQVMIKGLLGKDTINMLLNKVKL
jgi:hypothetical protein